MGLISKERTLAFLFILVSESVALASPKLRLAATTVGPLSIASNSNGTLQTVEAYNAGDGSLAPSASSSVTWLTVSIGSLSTCSTRGGQCIPVRIDPRTATLPKGTHTGIVTVSDPTAQDAPQTITVVVKMGGGVPDRVDSYVAPGGIAKVPFTAKSGLTEPVTAQSDGNWLSVAAESGGTFRSVWNYNFRFDAKSKGEGVYNGATTTSGSSLPEENKTTQAVMHVTSNPVLQLSKDSVSIRAAQGAVPVSEYLIWANTGNGTLNFASFNVTASGGDWLQAAPLEGTDFLTFTATPGTLAPGTYTGQVTVNSNAANPPIVVPVQFEVLALGPPRATYGKLWNVGNYDPTEPVAPGTWVELYGEQFTLKSSSTAAAPFPDTLGGVRVLVNNRAAPIWFVSQGQINFQIPYETAPGDASVVVERDGQRGNTLSLAVVASSPRIRRIHIADYGIIVNNTDGSYPMPATPGLNARPVRRGEALVIYLVGFGQTNPPVASGVPAPGQEPLARVPGDPVRVVFGSGIFGGIVADALFAGLTPTFSGLYQVNVVVPPNAPVGDEVAVVVRQGSITSNIIRVAIQ